MDDVSEKALSTAVQTVLAPVADVVRDVIGGTIGDPIYVWRRERPAWKKRNQIETVEKASETLRRRNVEQVSPDARAENIEEILDAAAERSAPEIKDLFARLLAATLDPARLSSHRTQFVTVVKQLEPLDAKVLMAQEIGGSYTPSMRAAIAGRLEAREEEVELAMLNLVKLGCARDTTNGSNLAPQNPIAVANIVLTTFGRELVRIVRD